MTQYRHMNPCLLKMHQWKLSARLLCASSCIKCVSLSAVFAVFLLLSVSVWWDPNKVLAPQFFRAEWALHCVNGVCVCVYVCPPGTPPNLHTLLFTAAPFSLLTNGSRGWSLPFTPPPAPLSTSAEIELAFKRQASLSLQSSPLSSPLLYWFSAYKKREKRGEKNHVSFRPQLGQQWQDSGIYLLHLYTGLLE